VIEQFSALAHTLERMHSLYQRALELLKVEKDSLVKLDFEKLYSELREKDEVLSILRRLDKERLKIQDHFAMVNSLNPADVTLKMMAEALVSQGGETARMGDRLMGLRARIQEVVEEIRERIALNEAFIEKSVSHLRGIAETFTQVLNSEPEAPKPHSTYTGKKKVQKTPQAPGKLLEKRL
jgi:hypothetical protein